MRFTSILALSVAALIGQYALAAKDRCPLGEISDFRAARGFEFLQASANDNDPAVALQVAHFKAQRAAFQRKMQMANGDFVEADYVLRRIMLAQMMGGSTFLFGPPGSAKSAMLRGMTHTPRQRETGDPVLDVFTIQVNELMNDALVKGYVSEKALAPDGKKFDPENNPGHKQAMEKAIDETKKVILTKMKVSLDQLNNANTMVKYFFGFVDEIDKANPIFAQAMLEILADKLAQYGPASMKVHTHFIGVTGNMTPYEFRDHFARQGYVSTANAFLDRMLMKIYVHNYLDSARNREAILKKAYTRNQQSNLLEDPDFDLFYGDGSKNIEMAPFVSAYPDVDVRWLGLVARKSVKLDEVTIEVIQELNHEMRSWFRTQERNSITTELQKDPSERLPFYQAPTKFSTRVTTYTPDTVIMSVFHDLLMLPDNARTGITSENLIKLMREGVPVDRFSAWRVQDMALTGAPGDARLYATNNSAEPAKLYFGDPSGKTDPIRSMLEDATDGSEKRLAMSLQAERLQYAELYRSIMARRQTASKKLGEVFEMLRQMTGNKNPQSQGIEERFTDDDPNAGRTTTVPVTPPSTP